MLLEFQLRCSLLCYNNKMSEPVAPPSYNENVVIPEQQSLSPMNTIVVACPPTSNINVAETSLIHSTACNCLHQKRKKVTRYRNSAIAWSYLLCCFCSIICCWIPFCMEGLKIEDEHCQQCKRIISSTQKKTKNAHIYLTVISIVCLVGWIFLLLYRLGIFSGRGY